MQAAILSMGDELVLGQTVDTNTAWLSVQLAKLGIPIREQVTIGDDLEATMRQLKRLAGESDWIIASGGLGPTDDDLTRHALARLLAVDLELHEPSLRQIEAIFDRMGWKMAPKNKIQAMIPRGCEVIENTCGTAPGLLADISGTPAFFLPGVPSEMKKMYELAVEPRLRQYLAGRAAAGVICSRTLHAFGIGESSIAERLGEMMARGKNPVVNTTAAHGIISIRINARAENEGQARCLIEPVEAEVRRRLGEYVYGTDEETMASVVGGLLRQRGQKVALAESCTGGLAAKLLTDVPGSSDYFAYGWVVYGNQAKTGLLHVNPQVLARFGAVSEPVAAEMTISARKISGADYGLGITGIAGPGGGTDEKPVGLVYIGLASAQDVDVRRFVFPGQREMVRLRAATAALNLLRLKLKI